MAANLRYDPFASLPAELPRPTLEEPVVEPAQPPTFVDDSGIQQQGPGPVVSDPIDTQKTIIIGALAIALAVAVFF